MEVDVFDHGTFLSPFTWRYGSREMREIFSEITKRRLWRKVWLALAEAQAECGLVTQEELEEIRSAVERVDLTRSHEIEREVGHDLVAELRAFAEQCPKAGGKLHVGATSMDIEDNADVLRFRQALGLILKRLKGCLQILARLVQEHKGLVCMAYTHLQPAEPTTLGYRFALYAQDLMLDAQLLLYIRDHYLKGKGMKGAVGTSASFKWIADPEKLEKEVMRKLGIQAYPIASQTYPRKLDYLLLASLASLAQSLYKFACDLRHLQQLGEVSEPFGGRQIGSSAMPFKRNPVLSERMCSLCRYVSVLPQVGWENAAQSVLERTLDDSANRRVIIPEAFLAVDECLLLLHKVLSGLGINRQKIAENLQKFGPFASLEPLLLELVKRGYNRQEMHDKLRDISIRAWERVDKGEPNPLFGMLREDEVIGKLENLGEIVKIENYVGDAEKRCEKWLEQELEPFLKQIED